MAGFAQSESILYVVAANLKVKRYDFSVVWSWFLFFFAFFWWLLLEDVGGGVGWWCVDIWGEGGAGEIFLRRFLCVLWVVFF